MSEDPIYIPCAAGTNVFAECRVAILRSGSVTLIGATRMEFAPKDAIRLAQAIIDGLGETPELPNQHQNPRESGDALVEAVRARLLERSLAGQAKYGAKMTRTDLTTLEWIRHAQEEALDMSVYLERLYRDLESLHG